MADDDTSGGSGYGDRQTAAVLAGRCIDLEQRLARLREALRAYATTENWAQPWLHDMAQGDFKVYAWEGDDPEQPWRLAQLALKEAHKVRFIEDLEPFLTGHNTSVLQALVPGWTPEKGCVLLQSDAGLRYEFRGACTTWGVDVSQATVDDPAIDLWGLVMAAAGEALEARQG